MYDLASAWEHEHKTVRRFLQRRLDNPADIDDLLQEAFLRLHRSRPALPNMSAVRAWLLHTTRNLVADHYRSGQRQQALEHEPTAELPTLPSPLHTLQPCIQPLSAKLPAKYREALALELAGVTQREIARRQAIGLSGAKSRVQRARRLLRQEFERCCRFEYADDGSMLDYRPKSVHACG
jgi:RNA polymerase sigma-70 factor (ECF subfamily)